MSGVQTITVAEGEGDQRLDRWLKRRFPHLAQGRIEKMCRKGELRVDGARAKASTRVEVGQSVRIPPLGEDVDTPPPPRPAASRVSDADAKMIRDCVIFRDDHIIALNKPAGLPVQGGSGQTRHVDDLSEALRFDTMKTAPRAPARQGHVGRSAAGAHARGGRRAHRRLPPPRDAQDLLGAGRGRAETLPGRNQDRPRQGTGPRIGGEGEKMLAIHPSQIDSTPGAKRAHTLYATLYRVASRAAWVAMEPVTGRTHQLRVHMAEMGHPIAGDGKYGGSGQENQGDGWGAQVGGIISKKLHLHARRLIIEHPVTKRPLDLTAPLPSHMKDSWDTFGWTEDLADPDPFEKLV